MITITPADKAFLQSIQAPEGVDAMVWRDGQGRVGGYAAFFVKEDAVELLSVQSEEPLMVDGLIRSVLNTGDCRGAQIGICRDDSLSTVLPRLEFRQKDGVWVVSIEEFFRAGCSHRENNP